MANKRSRSGLWNQGTYEKQEDNKSRCLDTRIQRRYNRGNMESVNVETRKQGVKGPKNQKIRSQAM